MLSERESLPSSTTSHATCRPGRACSARLHGRTALVGIANHDTREGVAALLRADGCGVVAESDGFHLVEQIAAAIEDVPKSERPDVIIADAILPGCTGLSLLAGLGDLKWQVPVILIVAAGDFHSRRKAWECGASGTFGQHFDPQHLRVFVSLILRP